MLFKLKTYLAEGELLKNYLKNHRQRDLLKGQTSDWRKINPGVSKGLVLGPLLFLIYINQLLNGITSMCKNFAYDTSLFSKVQAINKSANEVNRDLNKICNCSYQWKMQCNPDSNKQVNEIIFWRKSNSNSFPYTPVKFSKNNITMPSSETSKNSIGLKTKFQ